jgi:hypothetical protein
VQWIDRVELFFVCILGRRYGWILKVKDFKSDEGKVGQGSDPRSITDLEVRHAVLADRKKHRSIAIQSALAGVAPMKCWITSLPLCVAR